MPQAIEEVRWEEEVGNSRVLREPVGVVGAITPWNYPLHQIGAKVAPALAAGCTVVLKPSEVVPLNAFILAEVIESVGLPPGVFNLVTGIGPVVGEAIAGHPGVDMVSFTGSTRAGRRVSELAAATVKPVAMELGGKSPNVLLDDADFARAVPDGVAKCFLNSGQTCSALTRMLVPRERLAEVEELADGRRRGVHPRRPVRPGHDARPARLRDPARARPRLHRQGRGRGRQAADRRHRRAGGPRARLLRPPHRLLRGDPGDDDRPRGDLRPGAGDPALRRRGRRGADRQRDRVRARRRRLVGRPGARDRGRAAACAPARSRSTAAPSTRSPRSAATASPATAARTAASAWRSAPGQEPAALRRRGRLARRVRWDALSACPSERPGTARRSTRLRREGEADAGAGVRVFEPDAAAVGLDDRAGDRQAEAGAVLVAGASRRGRRPRRRARPRPPGCPRRSRRPRPPPHPARPSPAP